MNLNEREQREAKSVLRRLTALEQAETVGITSGTSQAATGAAALDFTGIPSTAKRVVIMLAGVSIDSANDNITFQLGDSGGIETSGYNGNSTMIAGGTATTSAMSSGAATIDTAATAASLWHGAITFTKIDGNSWVWNGIISNTTASVRTHLLSGYKTLSGTLDRVRITCNPANELDAGTVNIVYE